MSTNVKKKILIISYGGTIVMVIDKDRKAVVPAQDVEEILQLVPNLSNVADVTLDVLSNVDSTNVMPDDWTRIAYHIAEKRNEYDGFVITHGTNTMAYTASALTLALGKGLNKPVVLTGSQLPLTVYGNDARFNFENAVKTAVIAGEKNINEVMIVFDDVVLRGGRAVKVSESSFKAFSTPAYPAVADINSTGIHFNRFVRVYEPDAVFDLQPHFNNNVLTVDLVPGQPPALIEEVMKTGKCKGLILKSHGAGSVPTLGEYSFLPLIKKATEIYKIPVLITTKFLGGNSMKEVNDEPAVQAIEAGAISTIDMTDVMSQVKLMWLIGNGQSDLTTIDRMIKTNMIGEVTN